MTINHMQVVFSAVKLLFLTSYNAVSLLHKVQNGLGLVLFQCYKVDISN